MTADTPLARIAAYVAAIPTLYDDEDPMPEGLSIDTATDWTKSPALDRHELLYADLQALVDESRQALAAAWEEGAEATAEWISNNPGPSGIPADPPRNPYEATS